MGQGRVVAIILMGDACSVPDEFAATMYTEWRVLEASPEKICCNVVFMEATGMTAVATSDPAGPAIAEFLTPVEVSVPP